MRKRIQLAVDIKELKTAKKETHEAKKQAKARKKEDNAQLTKEDKQALKIEFIRAKIRHKAAKHAWKAAHKVMSPYLLKEVLAIEQEGKEKKKGKTKEEALSNGTAAKQDKIKKGKESKANNKKGEKKEKSVKEKKAAKTDIVAKKKAVTTNNVTVKTTTTTIKSDTVLPTTSKSTVAISTAVKTPSKPDNLTLIEGIGPKIAEVLGQNGVTTFKQLSLLAADYIKDILYKNNLRLADPTTWAEQARLVVEGKTEAFEALKKELKGGKRA